MIKQISRGSILVSLNGLETDIGGEMFFLDNDKLGFELWLDTIKPFWNPPNDATPISQGDREPIVDGITLEFERLGHTLDVA